MFPTIRCQNQFPNEFQQPESLCILHVELNVRPEKNKCGKSVKNNLVDFFLFVTIFT